MMADRLLETIRQRIKNSKDVYGTIRESRLEITASLAEKIEKLTVLTEAQGGVREWVKRLHSQVGAAHGHALELPEDELGQAVQVAEAVGDMAGQVRDLAQALLNIEQLGIEIRKETVADHAKSKMTDEAESEFHHDLVQVQTAVAALPVLVRVDPEMWTHLLAEVDLKAVVGGWAAQTPERRAALRAAMEEADGGE